MKIKVKEFVEGLYTNQLDVADELIPFVNPKGDCIDLRAAKDYTFSYPFVGENGKILFDEKLIDLGIAMQLPKGFSAIIKPRSSLTKYFHIIPATSGYIDNSYNGDKDEWKLYCVALSNSTVKQGDRICQFMIIPNQFATPWQKLKWLFNKRIKFEWVKELPNTDRGGHGSTGVK